MVPVHCSWPGPTEKAWSARLNSSQEVTIPLQEKSWYTKIVRGQRAYSGGRISNIANSRNWSSARANNGGQKTPWVAGQISTSMWERAWLGGKEKVCPPLLVDNDGLYCHMTDSHGRHVRLERGPSDGIAIDFDLS